MKRMPKRDITGECEESCRDRVREGEMQRQEKIASQPYSTPCPNSPPWTFSRNEPPGVWDGRV